MQLSDSNLQTKKRQEKQPKNKSISAASLAEKEPERGLLPVLKNGKFLTLWSGQVFSQLADKVYLVLMIAIIANQFQAEDQTISGWVSAIMIAFTIPAVLFGAGAGVYVDRWPKKAVLVVTNIVRGGLVLILPIILWLSNDFNLGNLPLGFCLMLLLTFLVSTLTQFFAPAEQAVIPLIVEKQNLLSANSLYTTTMMASVIIGFAVGDPLLELADNLVAKIGFGEALGKELVVGGSYAIAGLLLILLKTGEQKDLTEKEQPHILADLRDGLRYLKNHHRVRNAIIQQIVLFSIFAALAVLAVRLAEIIPGMEAEEFGLLLAAAGVGMAIGAGMVGQLGHWLSHFQLSMIGSIGMAVSLAGLSIFNQEFWVAMVLIGILGMFGAVVGVPMQTTVQAETPEEMRGKVFGLQNNAVNIALSLPLALVGVAETFLGLSTVLLGLAGAAIIAGIFFSFFSKPTFE
ncbi:arabinose efflux permease family protein [Hydrocoleum sp. CS-953]|uniref:MFS transporter n=1 Tax=Hydrocoleum sp. CS-953 TaxID=1671698 RepID=UPI000B9BD009|nr:MFS transporter [Hydrocoleum sp. CS-953]OZH52762.1 arabinose efflux permease family protein [Hydrocoleum sp. CS-953]